MTLDLYFTATSWFSGNVRVKPHSKQSGGPGANSNVVVITCPPPCGWKKITDVTKSGGSPPFLGPCSSPFYFTLKARSFESKPCVLLRCTYSQLSFPWSLDKMAFSLVKTWFRKRTGKQFSIKALNKYRHNCMKEQT